MVVCFTNDLEFVTPQAQQLTTIIHAHPEVMAGTVALAIATALTWQPGDQPAVMPGGALGEARERSSGKW